MKKLIIPFLLLAFSCENVEVEKSKTALDQSALSALNPKNNSGARKTSIASGEDALTAINDALAARGLQLQVAMMESFGADELGRTVFFNNRGNKQLSADFVPGDPRRGGDADIKYLIDDTESSTNSGLTSAQTNGAIISAMNTWDGVTCSEGLTINSFGPLPLDFGIVQNIFGLGGNGNLFTDIMHAGWLPGGFFDLLAPGGSGFILGVTFTLIWVDGNGNGTDIDNNGKTDVALREIYYNDNFSWNTGARYDVETVALHEAGHALSQGHFGTAFRTTSNNQLHFAPRAVMNAAYSGVQTTIEQTDNAGHCSNWGSWPLN